MKKLKTLEEHNKLRFESLNEVWSMYGNPRKNRIECPKCGEELLDSTPNIILTSNPPKLNIHCEKCNYRGYRIK